MSNDPILQLDGVTKYYESAAGTFAKLFKPTEYVKAVDGVTLDVNEGEIFGLVGESGSGKSTLAETMLRIERPTDGEILFKGENILEYNRREMKQFREDAQFIFQDPYGAVNPKKRVFQIVSEPLKNYNTYDSEEDLREEVIDLLFEVGLRPPQDYLESYPSQMSGGQLQRVNIARSLALEPDLIIADEPMSMLDVSIQAGVIKLLSRLKEKYNFTMVYISHNLSLVSLICDRTGVMYRGRMVEVGETEHIIHDPQHPYTQALINALPDMMNERERVILPDASTGEDSRPSGCTFHPRCSERMDHCIEKDPALAQVNGREVACFLHHDEVIEKAEDEQAAK